VPRRNERRFRQASATSFLQPPLYEDRGPLGTSPEIEAIRDGNYFPDLSIDPHTVRLPAHLKRAPGVTATKPSNTFTAQQYTEGWKKAKERTSSGRSGLHFGHFKANALHASLANLDYKMAFIPYATGFSPSRWRHGINIMLKRERTNSMSIS
jgi:hypothetical protein